MLKRIILFPTIFFRLFYLNAQGWDNLKLGIDVGFPIEKTSKNLGILVNVEPKLKISSNIFMGMRIAIALNTQAFENKDSTQFIIDNEFDHGFLSVIPTCDYYWEKVNFRSYLGLGVGPYSLANYIDVYGVNTTDPAENVFEIKVRYKIGFLIRGGVELGKARFGLEYNFVPKTIVESLNGYKVGTVNSSYLGITLGLILGG